MIKKETYRVDVVSTRDYSVDFEQIYNAVINEEGTNDLDCISDAFGDNVEYYLKKIYGYDFNDVDEVSMNIFVEMIVNDFYEYVNSLNYEKEK